MFTVPISLIYKREFARIERDFPIREVLPLIKTRNKDAERLGKESHKIFDDLEDMLGIALTLGQVGRVKYEQMRYQESISALSRAESIFEELESPYRAQAITDLELVRTDIGDDMFNEMSKNQ